MYVSDDEKRLVEEVFNNAVDCLSDEDKKLPQVRQTGLAPFLTPRHDFVNIHVLLSDFEPRAVPFLKKIKQQLFHFPQSNFTAFKSCPVKSFCYTSPLF